MLYLIEPLPPDETDQVNTLEEAVALVRAVGSPAVATMLDTKSASLAEPRARRSSCGAGCPKA